MNPNRKPVATMASRIAAYARRVKIENSRLRDPTKTTAVNVTHKPHKRKPQGTPPNTRTTASSGSEIASSSAICSSLLVSLPSTI